MMDFQLDEILVHRREHLLRISKAPIDQSWFGLHRGDANQFVMVSRSAGREGIGSSVATTCLRIP